MIEKLLCILLDSDIYWLSIKLLECKAELHRVVFLSITHLQETEHLHPLMQRVVVNLDTSLVLLHFDS